MSDDPRIITNEDELRHARTMETTNELDAMARTIRALWNERRELNQHVIDLEISRGEVAEGVIEIAKALGLAESAFDDVTAVASHAQRLAAEFKRLKDEVKAREQLYRRAFDLGALEHQRVRELIDRVAELESVSVEIKVLKAASAVRDKWNDLSAQTVMSNDPGHEPEPMPATYRVPFPLAAAISVLCGELDRADGIEAPPKDSKMCPLCNGTGKERMTEMGSRTPRHVTCSRCNGFGFVPA